MQIMQPLKREQATPTEKPEPQKPFLTVFIGE